MPDAATIARIETTEPLGIVRRALSVVPASFNAEARTLDVIWTTGARRATFDWDRFAMVDEELAVDPGSVRLERLNTGAPVLDTHSSYALRNVIGVVVAGSARIEGGKGVATVRLSAREDCAGIVGDIAAGIISNISVGYMVHKYEVTEADGQRPLYRAVDWEPAEISFVPVPADFGSHARAETGQGGTPCILSRAAANTEASMPELDPGAPPASATTPPPVIETRTVPPVTPPNSPVITTVTGAAVLAAVRAAGLSRDAEVEVLDVHAATPLSQRDLMAEIGQRFAQRDQGGATRNGISVNIDAADVVDRAVEATYLNRMNPVAFPIPAGVTSFRSLSMVEIGREWLQSRGVPDARMMGKREVANALISTRSGMHTTSDFPGLLGNVANKALRAPLLAAPVTWTPFVRTRTIKDFKPFGSYQLSDATGLVKVNESGEIKNGTIGASGEIYSLETFARIFALSRQAIINDDLGAFEDLPGLFDDLKRTHESDRIYDILTGNPVMGDGVALFHATHGNLAAAGSAISITSLGAARAAMSKQTNAQGTKLNIMPMILIVGPDKLTEAEQFVSTITANTAAGINPFAGKLQIATDARLVGNAWYLSAAPNASNVGGIELAHLEGEENGIVDTEAGFRQDGISFKVRIDTGVKAIDWRGLYKNSGA